MEFNEQEFVYFRFIVNDYFNVIIQNNIIDNNN